VLDRVDGRSHDLPMHLFDTSSVWPAGWWGERGIR